MIEFVRMERDGTVVTLTMNNPERINAFTQEMRSALTEAFTRLNDDTGCRAIVLAGEGPNFSAAAAT